MQHVVVFGNKRLNYPYPLSQGVCSSEYDLVCKDCRRRFDRIFSVKIESVEQERRLLAKWLKSLCNDCKRLLKEEGFIAKE